MNRYGEAPGTRRPYRRLRTCPLWMWRLLPYRFQRRVLDAWTDYETTEEFMDWETSYRHVKAKGATDAE